MKFSKKSVLSFALALALIFTTLPMPVSAAAGLGKSAFALNGPSAAVEVNGTEDEEAQVIFSMVNAGAVTMHQAQFDVVENEGAGNLTLTKLQAPFSHGGTNELVASTGKVLYADSSLVGYAVEAGGSAITATYVVDKDTPTGTYTVDYYVEYVELANGDYVEEMTYTATINVINTATPAPTQNYTVTLEADKETANIGETVKVAVTVDKPVNGIAATVSYDKNLFTYAGETDANGNIAVSMWSDTATQSIAELVFVAKNDGADDATGTFAFASADVYAGAYADFMTDAVPATTVSDTVKVLARTYTVSVTSDGNGIVTAAPATGVKSGTKVTLTVTPNAGYELETLTVADQNVTDDVENNQYTFTMPAANVAVSATFKESAPTFTVAIKDGDYVTGYTLVTVTGQNAGGYTYNGSAMFYVEQYNAYAILVEGPVTEEAAIAAVAEVASGTPTAISAGYDVNGTNKVDFNDAGAAFGCLNVAYGVADNMAMYLRADVNGDKIVDGADVSAIMSNYTK